MVKIHDWISEAAITLDLQLERLTPDESDGVFHQLRQRFADPTSEKALWKSMGDDVSRKRANGWQDVGEYVGTSPCLLVAEEDGPDVYRLSNGTDLTKLLGECPGFEFYVTNDAYDYLLCHNHHDYLIGAGAAAQWVATKCDE